MFNVDINYSSAFIKQFTTLVRSQKQKALYLGSLLTCVDPLTIQNSMQRILSEQNCRKAYAEHQKRSEFFKKVEKVLVTPHTLSNSTKCISSKFTPHHKKFSQKTTRKLVIGYTQVAQERITPLLKAPKLLMVHILLWLMYFNGRDVAHGNNHFLTHEFS